MTVAIMTPRMTPTANPSESMYTSNPMADITHHLFDPNPLLLPLPPPAYHKLDYKLPKYQYFIDLECQAYAPIHVLS